MSSILSTSSCGEGTHTTSLPDWPTSGVYSALGAWAKVQTAVAEKIRFDNHRLTVRHTDMFLLQLVGVKRKGPRQGLSLARPTSRRRDDGPASPGSSTYVRARDELRRHVRAPKVGRRATALSSDEPARRRESYRVVKRRKSEVVGVDPEIVEAPQRRLDHAKIIGCDRIHVEGHVSAFATPISGARRIAAGIVQFRDHVLAGAQCKNCLRHPRADSIGPDARQDQGGEHPDDHDHYHELHDSEPGVLAVGSSHVARCFLLDSEGQVGAERPGFRCKH